MNQFFYIVVDEIQKGPYSIEELNKENIKRDTLIWSEDMDDWKEAKNIKALEEILKKSPPPIPVKSEKPLKVEAEIIKNKEKKITPQIEVKVAKEAKEAFVQMRYGAIIGVLSFFIFYFGIYQVSKYDNYDINKNVGDHVAYGINSNDFPSPFYCNPSSIKHAIEKRKEIYTKNSIYYALITFLIASGTLITIRYVSKSVKWIDETSKKKL